MKRSSVENTSTAHHPLRDMKDVNLKVIRRILYYYEALLKDPLPEDAYISSAMIEAVTGISNNQIRQDFFYLRLSIGRQKKGYRKKDLLRELRRILNVESGADLIIIGAGKLGRALANYKLFQARNIRIHALFDVKKKLIGTNYTTEGFSIPIYHLDRLEKYLGENPQIEVALLTVPESAAEEVFMRLLAAGVKGVVNYSPRILRIPDDRIRKDMRVVNDCLAISLYQIIYQLH